MPIKVTSYYKTYFQFYLMQTLIIYLLDIYLEENIYVQGFMRFFFKKCIWKSAAIL